MTDDGSVIFDGSFVRLAGLAHDAKRQSALVAVDVGVVVVAVALCDVEVLA